MTSHSDSRRPVDTDKVHRPSRLANSELIVYTCLQCPTMPTWTARRDDPRGNSCPRCNH